MTTTAPHEMNRRIRFGSDGNGIFVALSRDGGKTWRHFDNVAEWSDVAGRLSDEQLPAAEYAAGLAFLRCEWHPSQPMPKAA